MPMTPQENARLKQTIAALAPIHGVKVGVRSDRATWSPDFLPSATGPQQTAANAEIVSYDDSQAAQDAWEAEQNPNRTNLRAAAANAIAANNTYVALATPTNPQVAAQVKALTQQNTAIIRRLLDIS